MFTLLTLNFLVNKVGRIKKEGFTTFSAINGGVYSSGRKINNREISNGTMIPRVKKEQLASIISIAEKINNIKETYDREYFFLVINTNSCFLQYNQEHGGRRIAPVCGSRGRSPVSRWCPRRSA